MQRGQITHNLGLIQDFHPNHLENSTPLPLKNQHFSCLNNGTYSIAVLIVSLL